MAEVCARHRCWSVGCDRGACCARPGETIFSDWHCRHREVADCAEFCREQACCSATAASRKDRCCSSYGSCEVEAADHGGRHEGRRAVLLSAWCAHGLCVVSVEVRRFDVASHFWGAGRLLWPSCEQDVAEIQAQEGEDAEGTALGPR